MTCEMCGRRAHWAVRWLPEDEERFACDAHRGAMLSDVPRGTVIHVEGLP